MTNFIQFVLLMTSLVAIQILSIYIGVRCAIISVLKHITVTSVPIRFEQSTNKSSNEAESETDEDNEA